MVVVHAKSHAEIRVGKIHGLRLVDDFRQRQARRLRSVEGLTPRYHLALFRRRMLMGPGLPAILAPGKPEFFRLFSVNMVGRRAQVFIRAPAIAHEDFIAPIPHPVICRPAPETALFIEGLRV